MLFSEKKPHVFVGVLLTKSIIHHFELISLSTWGKISAIQAAISAVVGHAFHT